MILFLARNSPDWRHRKNKLVWVDCSEEFLFAMLLQEVENNCFETKSVQTMCTCSQFLWEYLRVQSCVKLGYWFAWKYRLGPSPQVRTWRCRYICSEKTTSSFLQVWFRSLHFSPLSAWSCVTFKRHSSCNLSERERVKGDPAEKGAVFCIHGETLWSRDQAIPHD